MLQPNPASHVVELASGPLNTEYGEFRVRILSDGKEQCATLEFGTLTGGEEVFCRLHSECLCSHVFFSVECECSSQMRSAMAAIRDAGRGLVVYLVHEGRSNGAAAHIATQALKRSGVAQDTAYEMVGFPADGRDYAIAAKAIRHLGIRSVALISASERKQQALRALGVAVSELHNEHFKLLPLGVAARKLTSPPYTALKRRPNRSQVLIVGDIAIDYLVYRESSAISIADLPAMTLGGTAVNAARAFENSESMAPIVLGRVGRDAEGAYAQQQLIGEGIQSLIGVDDSRRTGTCLIVYGTDPGDRLLIKNEQNNANNYPCDEIRQALSISNLSSTDFVLVICHFLSRLPISKSLEIAALLREACAARVVLDLVPHNMYEVVSRENFASFCELGSFCLIAEWNTLARLLGLEVPPDPDPTRICDLLPLTRSKWLVLRHGEGNIEFETRYLSDGSRYRFHSELHTGYAALRPSERRGFGDRMTASLMSELLANDHA